MSVDSGIDSDYQSDLESVTSDLIPSKIRANRRSSTKPSILSPRYHGFESSVYPLPNDYQEIERLDTLQSVCYDLFESNVLVPLSQHTSLIGTKTFDEY